MINNWAVVIISSQRKSTSDGMVAFAAWFGCFAPVNIVEKPAHSCPQALQV